MAGSILPEAPVGDPSAAIDVGYTQSKLAAERILAARIPSDLPPIDWIPVDNVATVMDTFVLRHARETAQVFNICPSKGQS
ncbi:hypothetical protein GGS26DRAFT_588346 [Hypomontagnella submonticulosa]|nr:hypothetical protein GGS26DRAFT_588346 [Hypomontagnella submonticulosa]